MKSSEELRNLLVKIINEPEPTKSSLIRSFQNYIWESENTNYDEPLSTILIELAYDLDFYEPNEIWKKEDMSYYDESKLNVMLKDILGKI